MSSHPLPSQFSQRVLFLNANETTRPYRVAPLGLAFVASATKAAGHEVRFTDWPSGKRERGALRKMVRVWSTDILAVGLRNLDNSDYHAFESYLQRPAQLLAELRRERPEMRIILGGPAATVDPAAVLRICQPDHIILGEGEESFPEVLARMRAGERLPEIIGADSANTQPFRVAVTGGIPAPLLHEWLPKLRPYLRGDAGYPLQTKRGCPLKCSYCTYGRIEGARYRFLNPEAIADEVAGAMARGVRDFEFVDSTFNLPPRHAMEVLAVLERRGLRANFVGTGLNPCKLPDELLAAMRRTGFRSVILTAESASDVMLKSYAKNYTRSQLRETVAKLSNHGLRALWVFLVGGPGETPDTIAETLSFIEEEIRSPDAVYITSGIRIYPGSPIGDEVDAGMWARENLRTRGDDSSLEFFYSRDTPPDWLEQRLRTFQKKHPHVMLSCEGHGAAVERALRIMPFLPLRKPYWQYLPALNRIKRLLPFLN